jgi:hypothetical protein
MSCAVTPPSKGRRSPRNHQRGVAVPSRPQRHGGRIRCSSICVRQRYLRADVEVGRRHIMADRNQLARPRDPRADHRGVSPG